jgi:hypothetical protein
MAWTDEEDAYLLSEREKGTGFWSIARALNKSESNVRHRVWRLAQREKLFRSPISKASD